MRGNVSNEFEILGKKNVKEIGFWELLTNEQNSISKTLNKRRNYSKRIFLVTNIKKISQCNFNREVEAIIPTFTQILRFS